MKKVFEFTIEDDRSITVHVYDGKDRHAKANIDAAVLDAVKDNAGSSANAKLWELLTATGDRLSYRVDHMEATG